MNETMFDPRDVIETTTLTSAEARALKAMAAEYGLSKRSILRMAFLKLVRERHEAESIRDFRLSGKALEDE